MPHGTWRLVWRQSEYGSSNVDFGLITIQPDKENRIDLTTAIQLAPADWVKKKAYRWQLRDPNTNKTVATFRRLSQPQLAPPGKYRLIYHHKEYGSSESDLGIINLKARQLNEIPINTGVRLIPAQGMKAPYKIEFIELNASGKALRKVWQKNSFDPMPLKPGNYRINYQPTEYGSQKMTLVDSFELPAGNLVEIEL